MVCDVCCLLLGGAVCRLVVMCVCVFVVGVWCVMFVVGVCSVMGGAGARGVLIVGGV